MVETYSVVSESDTINPYGLSRLTSIAEARGAIGEAVMYPAEVKEEGKGVEAKTKAAAGKVDQLLKSSNEHGNKYPC